MVLYTEPKVKRWLAVAAMQLKVQRINQGIPDHQKRQGRESLQTAHKRAWKLEVKVMSNTLRLADLDGVLSSVCDCLVHAGCIADDAPKYLKDERVRWEPSKETKVIITINESV